MDKRRFLLLQVFVLVGTYFAVAAAQEWKELKRTAVILDTTGVSTEVTELDAPDQLAEFGFASLGAVVVQTENFLVAIRLRSVKSIDRKGQTAEVQYVVWGKESAITGVLLDRKITGKSDFGAFSLETSQLRQLTFKSPPLFAAREQAFPYPIAIDKAPAYDATLVLTDGTKVPVARLARFATYFSTKGYLIGGETQYRENADVRFLRGQSLVAIEFTALRTLQFGPGESITVTLKNGNTTTGQISEREDDRVDGFTGIYEKGFFFIHARHVKAIQFGPVQETAQPK